MSGILSLLGWSFLPNLVTGWVQSIYYSITIRAGDPKPQPGTPRFAEHRRRIHILVVAIYLLYTIYEADYDLQRDGSFYADLGVPLDATEREIKSRFRRLAAQYHPDKASTTATSSQADINAYFVHLKTASDTLLDPARRFAYERFGPDVLAWQHCATVSDYVFRGARVLVPYYGGAAALLYGLGLLGYLDWGRYERWLVLSVMFVFELHTITRPAHPPLFANLVNPLLTRFGGGGGGGGRHPPYLPFQAISLARKLSVTVYIAFSQIGPLLAADTSGGQINVAGRKGGGARSEEAALGQGLERLEMAARGLDADAARLLEMEMAPFAGGDEATTGAVKGKVREWLVQNTIRADPEVRNALGTSLKQRRVDAPAGARGNR
ncbi:hypothetical protein B0T17DRAFT_39094 [Bombardia bombarda]|uniref:J domain-containing protein n=1 Tax=Bombardia bombarda TaxID=252184 RepID=A0AA40CFE9_9PEZI|nr:hypothetical protein B0T17DRAFT_39094 [Bombardia bombarda]